MIPNLAEGDTVDITIRGARLFALPDPEDDPGERYWTFALLDANATTGRTQMLVSVPLDWPQASVERAEPESWPPQPGDEWESGDGRAWFALAHPSGAVALREVQDDSALWLRPDEWLDAHVSAVLVRRREVSS